MGYIVVTGAAGFIGSCLIQELYEHGYDKIVAVDDFTRADKQNNLAGKDFIIEKVDRKELFSWLEHHSDISFVLHIGARTDTTETNWELLTELNLNYTHKLWDYCVKNQVRFIYASSAATYGAGENGYEDNHAVIEKLQPLNLYGKSKNDFDKLAIQAKEVPPFWAGLKFFNVYGPNEYHKGRMASVIFHSYNQIKTDGKVKLFKSHRSDFENGRQLRDFIYVKDIIRVILFLMKQQPASGIYNLGTGKARSFYDLACVIFDTLNMERKIEFIDMPLDIRDKYQYFTEAKMNKLINAGYDQPFSSLEEGVADYVSNYLVKAYKNK